MSVNLKCTTQFNLTGSRRLDEPSASLVLIVTKEEVRMLRTRQDEAHSDDKPQPQIIDGFPICQSGPRFRFLFQKLAWIALL